MARVSYRKAVEAEVTRSSGGRRAFERVTARVADAVAAELKATGLADDPPAREYLEELDHTVTDRGGRVFTTASRAHFVEWGTIYRQADAPMRNAARRFGRYRGS